MKKTVSLFARNYDGDRLVRDEIVEGAGWVVAGEGVATRKYDGTCCMVRAGQLWKRYDAKAGKTPPAGFEPAQPEPDANTGHWPGWLPVGDGPDDARHREAFCGNEPDGTYELCGPKVQRNPEGYDAHLLIPHGAEVLNAPRTFAELRSYLAAHDIEGIVWHHTDGRMVKIKGKDFGIKRPGIRPPIPNADLYKDAKTLRDLMEADKAVVERLMKDKPPKEPEKPTEPGSAP